MAETIKHGGEISLHKHFKDTYNLSTKSTFYRKIARSKNSTEFLALYYGRVGRTGFKFNRSET